MRRTLGADGAGPTLVATFAFDRRYETELAKAGEVHDGYMQLEKERQKLYAPYYEAFAALLGITVVATFVLGFFLARGITRRINLLAAAINEVAAGNLEVRVPVTGNDELTELARVFNRMLGDMQQSRARIEYLQRIGAWQEMAQRLAHEIKNPLTPIQLAVQECHRKYAGEDVRFRALLDTTLEIVEEEVGTLRRLVGNFSSFARLPHAELREASLRDFLRECSEQLGHLGAELSEDGAEDVIVAHDVQVRWEVPHDELLAAIDRQMLRRVLVNLVRNAVEAIRETRPAKSGRAAGPRGRARGGDRRVVEPHRRGRRGRRPGGDARAHLRPVRDDEGGGDRPGPGDREEDRRRAQRVDLRQCPSERLGGAAFVVSLPQPHSLAIAAARDADTAQSPPSSRRLRSPACSQPPARPAVLSIEGDGWRPAIDADDARRAGPRCPAPGGVRAPAARLHGAPARGRGPRSARLQARGRRQRERARCRQDRRDAAQPERAPGQRRPARLLGDVVRPLPRRGAHRRPDLAPLARQGLVVVGVNTDSQDQGDPHEFALSHGLTYPIVHDEEGEASRLFAVDSLPTLVVVSRTGKITAVRTGITERRRARAGSILRRSDGRAPPSGRSSACRSRRGRRPRRRRRRWRGAAARS